MPFRERCARTQHPIVGAGATDPMGWAEQESDSLARGSLYLESWIIFFTGANSNRQPVFSGGQNANPIGVQSTVWVNSIVEVERDEAVDRRRRI